MIQAGTGVTPGVRLSESLEAVVRGIAETARAYFAAGSECESEIETIAREALVASDEDYGVAAAIAWAGGYEFPREMIESDIRCLRAAMLDFEKMVSRRLKTLGPDRLNKQRAAALSDDNPEKALMIELADGMFVPIPDGFAPNGKSATADLRSSYIKVHPAVNKMLGDVVLQGLAFLLPKAMAISHVPNLHLCTAHWTPKKGKPCGRPIGDLTHVEGTPLNTVETAAAAEQHYGPISHPTIDDIVRMIVDFWAAATRRDPAAKWSDVRLWKMDLRGAYTLLSFKPGDVGYFGMEVTGGLVYLQIAGIFGWTGTPAAFHVVTRALQFELRQVLASDVLMYVDDIIGVCLVEHLESDLKRASDVIKQLLGPGAVADEKTESGTRVDIIGYVVDLSQRLVSIARKNVMRTTYGFFGTDLSKRISVKEAQRLASWASRYGKICRVMRPFAGALHRLSAGRASRHALITITDEAKIAIRLWRAMLYLVRFDEGRFTRTIESFSEEPPIYIIEFDASLTGAGILWFEREGGAEVCLGGSAVDLSSLGIKGDSSYQNTCEYIGAILGMMGLIKLGVKSVDVELRGDSIAALTWAKTERPRGELVTNASMVFTLLCIRADLDVKVATHIAGTDNGRCDDLSRLSESGQTIEQTLGNWGLGGAVVVDLQGCRSVDRLLACCNPDTMFSSELEFIRYWDEIKDALGGLDLGC